MVSRFKEVLLCVCLVLYCRNPLGGAPVSTDLRVPHPRYQFIPALHSIQYVDCLYLTYLVCDIFPAFTTLVYSFVAIRPACVWVMWWRRMT